VASRRIRAIWASPHPSASRQKRSTKRGNDISLTDDSAQLWYGSISVGTPAVTFTGTSLSNWEITAKLTEWQWTSTRAAAPSFFPPRDVAQIVKGTRCTIPHRAPRQAMKDRRSTFGSATIPLLAARGTRTPSPSLVTRSALITRNVFSRD
jgi:hypothetical protein